MTTEPINLDQSFPSDVQRALEPYAYLLCQCIILPRFTRIVCKPMACGDEIQNRWIGDKIVHCQKKAFDGTMGNTLSPSNGKKRAW